MLQSIRDKARSWVTFIVVGIIAFMMAITGLETLAPNTNNSDAAVVNGVSITSLELSQSVARHRQILIQQAGGDYDPSIHSEESMQRSVLDALIDRELLLQHANDQKMDIDKSQIDKIIVSMQQFQQNGRFDADRFQIILTSYGMTATEFRNAVRDETLLVQLRHGIANTEFVTLEELNRIQLLNGQTRDLSWSILSVDPFRDAITLLDDEIIDYYNANSDLFMFPEQVIVNYLVLDKNDIANNIEVSFEDIKTEYQYRIEQFKQQSDNKANVSVIFIKTDKDRTIAEARIKAKVIINKLHSGMSFSELAITDSDDPITAKKGGVLGVVEPGFFGDTFDNTVANLQVGDISEPIETDFGIQILTVTSRGVKTVPSLDEMYAEIETMLKNSKVDAEFVEKSEQLVNISFESADLVQPSEQLGIKIMTSEPFGRNGSETGIGRDARVVEAAFSEDVLNLGANSDLIEITSNRALVLRVKEHKKSELIPLIDIRDKIVSILSNERAQAQLLERTEMILKQLQSGRTMQSVANEIKSQLIDSPQTSRAMHGVPSEIITEAFKMPHPSNNKNSYKVVALANRDHAIVELRAVHDGKLNTDSKQLEIMERLFASSNGVSTFDAYIASIKEKGNVKILLDID